MSRLVKAITTALVGSCVLAVGAPPAHAAAGDHGYDVSAPQCGQALPAPDAFAIVGVNSGLPYAANPCLATQATWAATTGKPMLYANTANPGHTSSHWSVQGRRSPAPCANASSDTDAGCAYDYGWDAALDALAKAKAAVTAFTPTAVTWWLDVEGSRTPGQEGNSWLGDGRSNAADLQGFVDALRASGVPEVGIYSTAYQWGDITQGYTRSTANARRASWPFTAGWPIEDGPVWFAGGSGTVDDAKTRCATASFTGGERLLSQYRVDPYDNDTRCADPDKVAPTAAMTAPTSLVSTSRIPAAWHGADTGGSGLATYDVRVERSSPTGSFGAWDYPVGWRRTAVTSGSLSPVSGWTYCLQARSRDAAGNLSPWTASRCTAVPLDDRTLTASSGWTRSTGTGWYAGTYSTSTRLGATLTRTGLRTARLHLLALRCATCGKVGVYVAGRLLTTVNLYATSTSLATIVLPRVTLQTATVVLKVATSGKVVRVDGLVSSRV